ncbi:MAG: response regulator [Pirellulales bacterium]
MRILVIDDNVDCAFMLRQLIRKCGHETDIALTAEAGLTKAKEWQPDVVFLDLAIPGVDGYKLAPRLRQETLQAAKIVAISGYRDDPARRAAAGIDAHLMKPASLQQLTDFFECEPLKAAS